MLPTSPDATHEKRVPNRGPFRALSHRNYRLFFTGQCISLFGTWIQLTALIWLAHHLTETSTWPSRIAAAHMLPGCIFGIWGGAIADRWPKRNVLRVTQAMLMGLAFLLAWFVLMDLATIWHLLVISAITGVVNAVDLPTRLSFNVEMVGREDLVKAVALNSLGFNIARSVGPSIAGVILSVWGPGWCFLINGFTFLTILVSLSWMSPPATSPATPTVKGPSSLLSGVSYVVHHPRLRILIPFVGVMACLGWPVLSLFPAMAHQFGAPKTGQGFMLGSFGLGALAAAMFFGWVGTWQRRRVFLALGITITAIGLLVLSRVTRLTWALPCCSIAGFGLVTFFAMSQSIVQLSAEDHNRGRVMAVYSLVVLGANPIGQLLIGSAADRWGELTVVSVQGLAILCAGLLLLLVVHLTQPDRHDK